MDDQAQDLQTRRAAVLALTCGTSVKVIYKWQAASGLSFDDFWALANEIGWRNEADLTAKPLPGRKPRKQPVRRLKKAQR